MPEKCEYPKGADSMLVSKFEALGLSRADIVFGSADPVVPEAEPEAEVVPDAGNSEDAGDPAANSEAPGDAPAAAEAAADAAANSEKPADEKPAEEKPADEKPAEKPTNIVVNLDEDEAVNLKNAGDAEVAAQIAKDA